MTLGTWMQINNNGTNNTYRLFGRLLEQKKRELRLSQLRYQPISQYFGERKNWVEK